MTGGGKGMGRASALRLAAWAGANFDTIGSLKSSGDTVFNGFGSIVLVFSTLGLISVTALNMYGGSLTLISALDSFKKVRPTSTVRIVTITITAVLSVIPALLIGANFLTNFEDFLLLVLYFFIPWTSVNLVDYYIVRRGHYAIEQIFTPDGIYGRWGWRGIVSYLVGFAAMTPFFSTGLYTGFVAKDLGGADISIFIGLPIAAILYYVFSRSVDIGREREVAARSDVNLEQLATAHARD